MKDKGWEGLECLTNDREPGRYNANHKCVVCDIGEHFDTKTNFCEPCEGFLTNCQRNNFTSCQDDEIQCAITTDPTSPTTESDYPQASPTINGTSLSTPTLPTNIATIKPPSELSNQTNTPVINSTIIHPTNLDNHITTVAPTIDDNNYGFYVLAALVGIVCLCLLIYFIVRQKYPKNCKKSQSTPNSPTPNDVNDDVEMHPLFNTGHH